MYLVIHKRHFQILKIGKEFMKQASHVQAGFCVIRIPVRTVFSEQTVFPFVLYLWAKWTFITALNKQWANFC